MVLTLGIDIGSTACKAAILEDGKRILSKQVVPLGTGTIGVQQVLDKVLQSMNCTIEQMDRVVATGYGRMTFKWADRQISELSCHAKGMSFLVPGVRTVIDIGGQDAKVLSLSDTGRLETFVMNDKCAAGTGRFLDTMARVVNVSIEEMGPISMTAKEVASISSTCTVFAESEVISKLSAETPLPDLVAGIHASVAKRVAALANRAGVIETVAMSGGVALNKGVVLAMERELATHIVVHPDCQLVGAIGAALYAWDDIHKA